MCTTSPNIPNEAHTIKNKMHQLDVQNTLTQINFQITRIKMIKWIKMLLTQITFFKWKRRECKTSSNLAIFQKSVKTSIYCYLKLKSNNKWKLWIYRATLPASLSIHDTSCLWKKIPRFQFFFKYIFLAQC